MGDNYYLDLVKLNQADGIEFFEVFSGKIVAEMSVEDEDEWGVVPKTGYRLYKKDQMGRKIYLKDAKKLDMKNYEYEERGN